MKNKYQNIVMMSLFILLSFQEDACAYLDPGSGSMIFQLLIASLLGALFFLKTFWAKFVSVLGGFLSTIVSFFTIRSRENR